MKYNNIFWLDDNPWFLSYKLSHPNLDLKKLLQRVTFAYDFEDGERITKASEFDLYILDGDFPNRLLDSRKEQLKEQISALTRGEKVEIKSYYQNDQVYGNFMNFYRKQLTEKNDKTIVYSIADTAAAEAFSLDLPFYHKSIRTSEQIIHQVNISEHPFKIDKDKLKVWEHGITNELIERYLINQ